MERHLLRVVVCLAVWLVLTPLVQAQTTVEYIHTDALGTPVAVTNSAGAVIERSVYEPYGQLINRPLSDGPGFTGHVQDAATGLTYMQQRYYDPGIGRFLSIDPVTAYGGDTRYFNRYWYAAGNPYKYTDPDGRILDTIADVGFLIYDVYKIATEGATATNMAALGADAAATFIPVATGAGAVVRGGAHAAEVTGAGKKAVTLADNAAKGKAGEAATRAKLGDSVAGEQVTFKTSDGTRTRTDFVTKDGGVVENKDGRRSIVDWSGEAKSRY